VVLLGGGKTKASIDCHHAQVIIIITLPFLKQFYLLKLSTLNSIKNTRNLFNWDFCLTIGEDIEKALDGPSGTSMAYLKSNRSQSNTRNSN
jgi:hypothetical protein